MSASVEFHYLYRDASNYKAWGSVVFAKNPAADAASLNARLEDALLPDGLFIADQVQLPELFRALERFPNQDDHCFHEFDRLVPTNAPPTDFRGRSIEQFVLDVESVASKGWLTFDVAVRGD